MRRAIILFIGLAFGGAVPFIASCKHDAAGADAGGGGFGGGGRGRGGAGAVFAVDVLAVEAKRVDYTVQAPGTIDAFERVQVTARVAGVVDRVAFSEGQNVKKGDVLVVIDSERYQLAVNGAKAAVDKAIAAEKDNEAMVTRREGALSQHPGLITDEELETYKTKRLTAKADTASAQEALKVAEVNLRDAFVRAPMEGVIQTRTVETGQYVSAGYLMATLIRSDPLLLHFQVEPQDAPRLKPAMPVTFTMRETQEPFKATISLVAAAADPTTHTVGITANVDTSNKKYWLRPGSFCDVTIDVGATRDAVMVPRVATRATDHGYVVYVVEGSRAVEKSVTLGMNTKDGWAEVRSGLAAGELLVVRGVESMANGVQVHASKVDSLDASAPEVPLFFDAGGAHREGGAHAPGAGSSRAGGRSVAGGAAHPGGGAGASP